MYCSVNNDLMEIKFHVLTMSPSHCTPTPPQLSRPAGACNAPPASPISEKHNNGGGCKLRNVFNVSGIFLFINLTCCIVFKTVSLAYGL